MSARVLLITNDFPPRDGGIESYLRDFCARLDPANLVVLASSRASAERLRAYDESLPFRVYRMRDKVLLPLPHVAGRAARIIKDERIDTVWFGAAAPLGLLADACRRAGASRIVSTTHGHEVGWSMLPVARQMLRRIGNSSDVVTYISRYTRGRFAAAFGPRAAFERLPSGVDIERFSPNSQAGQDIRQRYGIGAEQPLIVCISRLVRRKGQDMLIRSMPQILARHPDARLLIVGVGPRGEALQQLAQECGVADQTIFAGKVSFDELPAYYNAATVFAMPARTRGGGLDVEGLGIVYLEAQACGIPVVAGNSGGAPETVIDGETGIVVNGASVDSVMAGVLTVLGDPERAAAMGIRGRQHVTANWTWEVMAARARRILGN
ncbi:MAG: glycosyltransferase family 4 protein [Corynebacterium sp.]|uniref:glycosyltransferase family 4 protein n=1 Tax=Corynebacterium sp. TaxID=1720 RepID=UPI0026DCE991|nr:glycosyltransferase family 4 protein [Corynebacterium sp.]MDO5029666.1 glycosyltransferase family 4 protein [Corynebacterium sp.]